MISMAVLMIAFGVEVAARDFPRSSGTTAKTLHSAGQEGKARLTQHKTLSQDRILDVQPRNGDEEDRLTASVRDKLLTKHTSNVNTKKTKKKHRAHLQPPINNLSTIVSQTVISSNLCVCSR